MSRNVYYYYCYYYYFHHHHHHHPSYDLCAGHAVAQLVEGHCATSQKVAGSIPNGVFGIFHWHNLSGRTVALGLTQPLTETSTRNISWGRGGGGEGWGRGKRLPMPQADNLTTFMSRLSWNLGASSSSWNTQGLSRPVMGLLYLFFHLCAEYLQLYT
jgi:hypothetical protein